jgi:hypothetical protein
MTKSVLEGLSTAPARAGAARVVIPATLHDSLVARLDRLGAARRIANVGATIGRRFSYDLLAEVMNAPEAELSQGLLELTRSGLVEGRSEPPDSEYLFKHALIRDAAYESVLQARTRGAAWTDCDRAARTLSGVAQEPARAAGVSLYPKRRRA